MNWDYNENAADLIQERFQTIVELTRVTKKQHSKSLTELEIIKNTMLNCSLASGFEHFGSYTKLSATRDSDFDIFAIMPFMLEPKGIMNYLRDNLIGNLELEGEFHIVIDYPSLTIQSSNTKFDLIPANPVKPIFCERPELMIFKNEKELMRVNPDFQQKFIDGVGSYEKDEQKEFINLLISFTSRIFNFWKRCYRININIPTFYLQIILAGNWQQLKSKPLSKAFHTAISLLSQIVNKDIIYDPYAHFSKTQSTMPTSFNKKLKELLERSRQNCYMAVAYEDSGEFNEAVRFWKKVFNNKFPSQGTQYDEIGWGQ